MSSSKKNAWSLCFQTFDGEIKLSVFLKESESYFSLHTAFATNRCEEKKKTILFIFGKILLLIISDDIYMKI